MLLVLGFIYTLFNIQRYKEEVNLMTLSAVTIIGRAIWWIIG
ncbi:MAG: hypothetical protein WCL02_08295 [bacterium]